MSQNISFRVKDETYLMLAALASEKGLSVGTYLRKRLEDEDENIFNDVKLMQTDLKDISHMLIELKNNSQSPVIAPTSQQSSAGNEAMLLETLMILRELAQPSKLANAQAKVTSVGLTPYKLLENQI